MTQQIDAQQVIARYQQDLANMTHRAILAEATLAQTLGELEALRTTQTAPGEGA